MNYEALLVALGNLFGQPISEANYQTTQLQGGTLGDVQLVEGLAISAAQQGQPYRIVWKKQKRWERPGDPGSWRREYDLYHSELGAAFSEALRWPKCYHAQQSDNEIQLWIEYIDGESGCDLEIVMLEQAARELGRFQGRVYAQSERLSQIACLGDSDFLAREHQQWHRQLYSYENLVAEDCPIPEFLKQMLRDNQIQLIAGKSFEYSRLRSSSCELPEHLKAMLIEIDERRAALFEQLKSLPVVLCHRDFWVENIFFSDGQIRLIDWDTAGWGYLGEDLASLIVDDVDAELVEEYAHRLFPAYLEGISEYIDISQRAQLYLQELILIKFGYRIFQEYLFSEDPEQKAEAIVKLQAIYELG